MKIFKYIEKAFGILFIILKIVIPLGIIAIGAYHVLEKGNEIPSMIISAIGFLLFYLIHVPIKEKKINNNYQPE